MDFNIQPGDLVTICHSNEYSVSMFLKFLQDGQRAHYKTIHYSYKWYNKDYRKACMERLQKQIDGDSPLYTHVDYINSGAVDRILPLDEKYVDELTKSYLNLLRKTYKIEYKNNRPVSTF
tara:strand:- start:256 stop:615 length:360 start_codon:yes stop_codon:yes gene_type:complete